MASRPHHRAEPLRQKCLLEVALRTIRFHDIDPRDGRSDGPRRPCATDHHSSPRRRRMFVEAEVAINGSKAALWAAITDIEHHSETMRGIESIEVVQKPANGLVGLRWRETRMLFGKPATAEKWITEAVENAFYKTRAESDGFIFLTTITISGSDGGGLTLTSSHDSQPQGFFTRLMSIPMGLLFK